ncbi:MAG: Prephenate dehydrogenase [Frankiales bacterium]|nr:Prephenate dehydrogenase [Frankiales bacterium]
MDLLVVGSGLIGTSIGLALRGQLDVALHDPSAASLEVALGRGAGRRWDGQEAFAHCLVAAPPSAVAGVLASLPTGGTFSHVASVQRAVQASLEEAGVDVTTVCGSHPMAGKEQSGPAAATAELFVGRPWVLCPSASTSAAALEAVRAVAVACGAEPLVMTAEEHDAAVALVSHLPQVAASAVAAVLGGTGGSLDLAGPGLQDTTRIAGSNPALWVEVLRQNAAAVAPLVRELSAELAGAADALDRGDLDAVEQLLRRGNDGRGRVPRKRGEHDRDFVPVSVSVPDEPGQLAGVLVSAAQAGINVEDVRVEHLPGRPTGVIELLVHLDAQAEARRALAAAGWEVVRA